MIKPLQKLSEIPELVKYSKYLVRSNYLSISKSKGILQECSVYADKYRNSSNNLESEKAVEALHDLKEFGKWLRERTALAS